MEQLILLAKNIIKTHSDKLQYTSTPRFRLDILREMHAELAQVKETIGMISGKELSQQEFTSLIA